MQTHRTAYEKEKRSTTAKLFASLGETQVYHKSVKLKGGKKIMQPV